MKALQFSEYGKAQDVLKLVDLMESEPGDGQVKVKMLMAPINPSDIFNTIEGTYKKAVNRTIWNHGKNQLAIDPNGERTIPELPQVPGLEGVGVVVKAGKGLRGKLMMGKRVLVIGGSTWQEYSVVDAKQVLPASKKLTNAQAATSFVNPVTAYIMTREVLKCQKGSFLLQSAGNSELGKMVIRLGKHYGFKTINLIRNKDQAAHLKSLGADHVIDITTEDLKTRIHEITGGKGANFGLDPIGGELPSKMIQCLGLRGRMLVYGTLTTEPLSFSPRDLMTPLTSLEGFFLTNYMAGIGLLKKLSIIGKVGKLVASGVLDSEIGPHFTLAQYQDAISAVNQPGNKGKVLFKIAE